MTAHDQERPGIAEVRGRLDEAGTPQVTIGLGELPPAPEPLRVMLARTLHDPLLELAFWLPEARLFVDALGERVDLTATGLDRAVTFVEHDGRVVAAVTHAAGVAVGPALTEAGGQRWASELREARLRAQLVDSSASRARLVDAADRLRHKLERDLHDGAQQRLASVALALGLAGRKLGGAQPTAAADLVAEAGAELDRALADLRALARDVYPVLLTESGLGPALTSLTDRSPVPATVSVALARRLPGAVERNCYFVVAEALKNVATHSFADRAEVVVREQGGVVIVEVRDDGAGGADPGGPGLSGLADRVAAHGGRLRVESRTGTGTRVMAELPCA